MNFFKNLFRKKQSGSIPNDEQVQIFSFSSFDSEKVSDEMGEMYFQCPNCGAYERVNDFGKMMIKSDPNYFKEINCIKCNYAYDARARLKGGRCPGFDYSQID